MKDSSHHTSSKDRSSYMMSDDSSSNTSSFSFLNTPQEEYLQHQVSRETELLDSGDHPPLCNERPSKKNHDVPWNRQGGYQDVDASLQKVHEPESIYTSDFGLEKTKMSRQSSQGTPLPPPPSNRSKPGAVSVPGFQSQTFSIELPMESTSRSEEEPSKTLAPILQASVVDDQEEPSSPTAPAESLPVYAEAMKEIESSKRSCCVVLKDRRLLAILVFLVIIILCFTVGMSIVLTNKETVTTTTVEYIPATPVPTPFTMAPSPAPTETLPIVPPQEFEPPSEDQCLQIASGLAVPNQDQTIQKTYHIELDVVVEPNVSNLDHHFGLLVDRLQDTLAPKLAQCDMLNRKRKLRGDSIRMQTNQYRNLVGVSDYLVANAQFSHATVVTNQSCKAGTPQPCYKVIETIDLYIKQEELDVRLIGTIMDVFDAESLVQLLDLVFPFKDITMIGVTSNTDANSNSNIFDESPDDEDE